MFILLFTSVLMMLAYMAMGFTLCKVNKAVVSHAKSMSAVLLYIMNPAMLINSFLQLEYTHENLIKLGKYFCSSLLVQILFFGVLFLFFHRKYHDAKYRILTAGGVLGNVGFMGMPLIASIFPDEPIVLCYSSINVTTMNLIVFTIGVYLITNDKEYVKLKNAILNPTSLAIIVSFPLFLLNVKLPDTILNAISILAKAVTPMCMIILGMRLSASKLKDVFTRPFVYATSAFKLIVFPVFAFLLVKLMPFLDPVAKTTVIVLATVPAGAVIESLSELYECEQEFAANVVLLTTMISVITIPVMISILV